MTVKIRLTRRGSKKRPYYKVVVANATAPRDGDFIAELGFFNPAKAKDSAERFGIKIDLVKDWIAKGAQMTDRVAKLMDAYNYEVPGNVSKRLERLRNNPKKLSKKEMKEQA
ncbi:MAG: 30S ribosomal protein S16 [Alphaproteobacteria bacterium]|nr:30S ribosomal protein S16 [Alphaproteobacteria bacterium]OJV15281.1 MAG: 30S ribosomal protein S16 [Alphaproteobacteria bacterium 33-17]